MDADSRTGDLLYRVSLLTQPGVGSGLMRDLIATYGSAEAVFHTPPALLRGLPQGGRLLSNLLSSKREALLERGRRELDFMQAHHIRPLSFDAEDYPRRLRGLVDAPALLYSMGPASLDAPLIVAIVGTRRCTQYGVDLVRQFVHDLRALAPGVLIVSGLALGIDGAAHAAALTEGLPTVGVLAHGLDHIYPAPHRSMAAAMLRDGGLLTEYHSFAATDRGTFLARNRIVAGLADVVVVVESALKGGSLVTARLGREYGRCVCAFPGRTSDECSRGCNDLIRRGCARLISSAADVLELLGVETAPHSSVQQSLLFDDDSDVFSGDSSAFGGALNTDPTLSPDEQRILEYLHVHKDAEPTELCSELGLDAGLLYELLLKLEMDNRVRNTKGNRYELR